MIIDNDFDRCRAFLKEHGGQSHVEEICIGYESNGDLIAAIGYGWYTGKTMHMHIAKLAGRYVPMSFMWFAFYYPFVQCGVKMLMCVTDSMNKADKIAQHAGFRLAHSIPDAGLEGDLNTWILDKQNAKLLNYKPRLKYGRF
jgi:hypothetical protein